MTPLFPSVPSSFLSRLSESCRDGFSPASFPTAPEGRHGWPWEPPPEASAPAAKFGPRISVVIPSFNQAAFLEQTLRSVLLQPGVDVECIVIDGGSTDGSVEILRQYAPWLAYWVSERDRGQSHAINKGLARSTGQILCWLNSDDYYLPRTLEIVRERLQDGAGAFALVGHCLKIYADGRPPVHLAGRFESQRRLLEFWKGYEMHQPAIFWRREVFETVGFVDESLHLIMDFDYWARIARRYRFENVDEVLACATYHEAAKTGDEYAGYHRDLARFARRYWGSPLSSEYWALWWSWMKHYHLGPMRRSLSGRMQGGARG